MNQVTAIYCDQKDNTVSHFRFNKSYVHTYTVYSQKGSALRFKKLNWLDSSACCNTAK